MCAVYEIIQCITTTENITHRWSEICGYYNRVMGFCINFNYLIRTKWHTNEKKFFINGIGNINLFNCHTHSAQQCRVSDPMLNPVPKSVHFLDYLNFGALIDIFLWSICWSLCNLALVIGSLISRFPNLYKSKIFRWSNHGTKGVEQIGQLTLHIS